MDSFAGLEFENDILGDIDFDQNGINMVNMGGSGLDSPGHLPFSVGTPTGIASLGTSVFPGMHAPGGGVNNNQSNTSGNNTDMNNGRDNDGFHDDDSMFFGSDMPKGNDDKSKTQQHPAHAPTMNRNQHMNHDKVGQVNSGPSNPPAGQPNMGNNMHHNNLMGRKDSAVDTHNTSRPNNGAPVNQSNPSNAAKPGNAPGGQRMPENSDPSSLLSTLLMPDNPIAASNMGGPSNMPGSRPHINQGGPNAPNGGHPGMNQYNPMGQQPPYGQQQRGGMMMNNPNGPGNQMYNGYNQPPPQSNQPRPPYQLHRTMSMNSAPSGSLMRQTSSNTPNFPTNYEEELANLKNILSSHPDLIPPPAEVLRVTQQQCITNMQRMQMQQHNPNPSGGNYITSHMPPNMSGMPPNYRGQMPNQPPSSGPPTGNPNASVMGMDTSSMPRPSNPGAPPSSTSTPNHPSAPSSAASVPTQNPAAGRPGVPSSTAPPQNQLTTTGQIPQAGGAPGQQMVSQQPGNKTNNVWQSESDVPLRRKMIAKIVSLLQQRKPDAPTEWIRRLPDMARRLEDSLYRTATSRDIYGNFNTLKTRLQHLAVTMGARAAKGNSLSPSESQPAATGAPAIMAGGQQGPGGAPTGPPSQAGNTGRPGGPPGNPPPSGYNQAVPGQQVGSSNQPQQGRMNPQQMQQHQMQMQMQQQNQRQMANQQNKSAGPPGQNQRPGMGGNPQGSNPSMVNQNQANFQRQMNGQPNQPQRQMYGNQPTTTGQHQNNNGSNRVPSPNPSMRTNMQPPQSQRTQSNPTTSNTNSSRMSESLSDMDSPDFLGDLGIGDDGSDLTDDPIDALMRGSDPTASKEKKSPDGNSSMSPSKNGPKRQIPGQPDNQAAKRAKPIPTKRTPPRNNSASPPVVKTPPPTGPPGSNPGGPKQNKTPPPVNK